MASSVVLRCRNLAARLFISTSQERSQASPGRLTYFLIELRRCGKWILAATAIQSASYVVMRLHEDSTQDPDELYKKRAMVLYSIFLCIRPHFMKVTNGTMSERAYYESLIQIFWLGRVLVTVVQSFAPSETFPGTSQFESFGHNVVFRALATEVVWLLWWKRENVGALSFRLILLCYNAFWMSLHFGAFVACGDFSPKRVLVVLGVLGVIMTVFCGWDYRSGRTRERTLEQSDVIDVAVKASAGDTAEAEGMDLEKGEFRVVGLDSAEIEDARRTGMEEADVKYSE
ncbi:hypothetical protein BU16DRAFT_391577 [Lophium mytilinum]|uniref:Uncharacterized protein n=1 Tax=Lophium mytilinum TaxID=390894 RepID=A0A6A6QTK5_9PEZI|nr:hypothetical protein BU16DRAFT_391577 [Lophium mytilinum]